MHQLLYINVLVYHQELGVRKVATTTTSSVLNSNVVTQGVIYQTIFNSLFMLRRSLLLNLLVFCWNAKLLGTYSTYAVEHLLTYNRSIIWYSLCFKPKHSKFLGLCFHLNILKLPRVHQCKYLGIEKQKDNRESFIIKFIDRLEVHNNTMVKHTTTHILSC